MHLLHVCEITLPSEYSTVIHSVVGLVVVVVVMVGWGLTSEK